MRRLALLLAFITSSSASLWSENLPLINGSFDDPEVSLEEFRVPASQAPGWTLDVNRGTPVISRYLVSPPLRQSFRWTDPDGSLSQMIDPSSHSVLSAGDIYSLSFGYSASGPLGTKVLLAAEILIDGVPAAMREIDATNGPFWSYLVRYTARAEDIGKPVGVRFRWSEQGPGTSVHLDTVFLGVESQPAPPPELRYILHDFRHVDGTWGFELSWPACVIGYVLQTADSLSIGTAWQDVQSVGLFNGNHTMHVPAEGTRFYRLLKQD